jgi:hypothetical protein
MAQMVDYWGWSQHQNHSAFLSCRVEDDPEKIITMLSFPPHRQWSEQQTLLLSSPAATMLKQNTPIPFPAALALITTTKSLWFPLPPRPRWSQQKKYSAFLSHHSDGDLSNKVFYFPLGPWRRYNKLLWFPFPPRWRWSQQQITLHSFTAASTAILATNFSTFLSCRDITKLLKFPFLLRWRCSEQHKHPNFFSYRVDGELSNN